jgi:hypothetical protein
MKIWFVIASAAIALACVAGAAGLTSHASDPLDGILYWPSYHQGQAAILDKLYDPDSAEFRNLYFSKFSGFAVLCGKVNARNRLGGYTGFQPFYSFPNARLRELTHTGTDPNFVDMTSHCGTPPK